MNTEMVYSPHPGPRHLPETHSHSQQRTTLWIQVPYTCSGSPVYLIPQVPQGFFAFKVPKRQLTKKHINFERFFLLKTKTKKERERMILKVIIIVIFWETTLCQRLSWKLYLIVKQLCGIGIAIPITDKRINPDYLVNFPKSSSEGSKCSQNLNSRQLDYPNNIYWILSMSQALCWML